MDNEWVAQAINIKMVHAINNEVKKKEKKYQFSKLICLALNGRFKSLSAYFQPD